MVSVQTPLVGLEMNSEVAHYVGILESTLAAYALQEVKYRALLELLTGESWETTRISPDPASIKAIAVEALVKRAGIDPVTAKVVVEKRWNEFNQDETPKAVPVEEFTDQNLESAPVPPSPGTMRQRLDGYFERQRVAAKLTEEEAKSKAPE